MTKIDIKEFISNSTYSTIYSPIYDTKTNEIYAYEALSKFVIKKEEISCSDYFSKLHGYDEIFFFLEKKNKQHQLSNSNMDKKIILYFDAIVFKKKEYRNHWEEYLFPYKDRIIISITPLKNLDNKKNELNLKIFKWLIKNKFEFIFPIFDDSLYNVPFKNIEKASYLKIHKKILSKALKNDSYKKMLNFIIDFAHDNGTKTIIKHIDSENEIKLTDEFLFDYIQK